MTPDEKLRELLGLHCQEWTGQFDAVRAQRLARAYAKWVLEQVRQQILAEPTFNLKVIDIIDALAAQIGGDDGK